MKVTIKDIAKEAGVSIGAVSLVLNGKKCRVSQETKDRIFEVAKRNNYVVNQAARSLVTKESKILGLIIPDIENLFFSKLAKELEILCRSFGYFLIVVNSDDKLESELNLIRLLESRNIDGLFIVVSNESYAQQEAMENTLSSLTIPFIMIDRTYSDFNCNKVYFDDRLGVSMAIHNLYENGHRKIACIAGGDDNTQKSTRLESYYDVMKELNCEVKDNYVFQGDYRFESGYLAGKYFQDCDITGIFICNDMMSLGYMKYLDESNSKIPDKISIISYDNVFYPLISGIKITSIEQNVKELVQNAMEVLVSNIANKDNEKQEICLKPLLIKQDSVKKIL